MTSTAPDLSTPFRADAAALGRRRLALVVPSAALVVVLWGLSWATLADGSHSLWDWLLLLPFCLVMGWECMVVWQLVLGAVAWARGPSGRSALELRAERLEPVSTGRSRTAIAIPIHEEDPEAVRERVAVMLRSLARTGPLDDVDVHILSDTRTPAVAAREEAALAALRAAFPDAPVSYRRREQNLGRKAGNVMEFLDRTAGRYDFAIVLDADSLMSGAAMRRLIRLMEESPAVGLIQTVSYATGRDTLFARVQQFAVRLYAPLPLRGLDFWQGPHASYWGHNAILRVEPFRRHCRLPVLPGRPPLGGEILCHDVVEAALMARAGWETHLLPDLEGTWEEMPTNALDLMARERRWCQGNLQHMQVFAMPGLRGASRGHIALGIGGYLTAVLWWMFLLGGAARVLLEPERDGLGLLAYGLTEPSAVAGWLAAFCLTLLLLPRVLNLGRALLDSGTLRDFGGAPRLLVGAVAEQLFWLLLGPVLSLVNAGFVLRILFGQSVGWAGGDRGERRIGLGEALGRHGGHIVVGAALAWACVAAGGWYALFTAPTALGLLLSPALTAVSASRPLGQASRRLGLFLTVDDLATAPELAELRAAEV